MGQNIVILLRVPSHMFYMVYVTVTFTFDTFERLLLCGVLGLFALWESRILFTVILLYIDICTNNKVLNINRIYIVDEFKGCCPFIINFLSNYRTPL